MPPYSVISKRKIREGGKMNYLVKSAQVIARIMDVVMGHDFVSPTEIVLNEDPYIGLYH